MHRRKEGREYAFSLLRGDQIRRDDNSGSDGDAGALARRSGGCDGDRPGDCVAGEDLGRGAAKRLHQPDGLVWHDGLLWLSYYTSCEGKSSICLACFRLPKPGEDDTDFS